MDPLFIVSARRAEAARSGNRADPRAMGVGFAEALAVVGGLLIASAALSGLTLRTILSTSVLAVGAGNVLSLTGVISLSAGEHVLVLVVELVLLLTLFSDGLLVEDELLRRH